MQMAHLAAFWKQFRALSWRSEHDPEPKDEVMDEWAYAKTHALRRPAISLESVPSPAADYFLTDRVRRGSLRVDFESSGIGTLPIQAPFPNIPLHVVQAPGVRRFLPHRVRHGTAVRGVPSVAGQARQSRVIAIAESCRGAS